jgi:hypothetical protein
MITSSTGKRVRLLGRTDLRIAAVAAAMLAASASASHAQVDLTTYTDAKGYLNVRGLTCA